MTIDLNDNTTPNNTTPKADSTWTDTRVSDFLENTPQMIDFLGENSVSKKMQEEEKKEIRPRRNRSQSNPAMQNDRRQRKYPNNRDSRENNQQMHDNSQKVDRGQDKPAEVSLKDFREMNEKDLDKAMAELNLDTKVLKSMSKSDKEMMLLSQKVELSGNKLVSGYLEIMPDMTHGILRTKTMQPGDNDVYVSGSQIRRFNLRKSDFITGQARPSKEGERYLSMLKIEAVNEMLPEEAANRANFDKLTPVFPDKQIKLETTKDILSTRIIDLLSPIGHGQRGMIVAPPKSGKTFLLKDIALGIVKNSPDVHLMIVLIGERPEEVTDIERTVKQAEVIASNFDEAAEVQTKVAEMALERAKRLVELGQNVVILMDSITRLSRAYNISIPPSGRTLSGGMDPAAIYPSKRFFGAARNFEVGGSLTIIATALVETGSRMDEVIFEEFKGTGNMELKLDRDLADKKIYPSIDVISSGTRNEELLLGKEVLSQSWRIRRMLQVVPEHEATDLLIQKMRKTDNNREFLQSLAE